MMSVINREFKSLHSAAAILAAFTVISQLLALVRDRVFATTFGTSEQLDVYYAAFRIPDLLFIFLGSLVSVSLLIPIISSMVDNRDELKGFINKVFSYFIFIFFISSIALWFLMPYILELLFYSKDKVFIDSVTQLSRIMLLSPLLLSFSSLFSSLIQIERKFIIYSLSPIFYNLGIILGGTYLYSLFGILGLAYGVVIGSLLHVLVLLPSVIKSSYFPQFSRFSFIELTKQLAIASIPRTLSLSMNQILFTFALSTAALFTVGSITRITWAYNLFSVPVSLIGVSYSLSAFSLLSQFASEGHIDKFKEKIISTLRWIIFLSIPVSLYILVFSEQIVRILLGGGNFDAIAQNGVASLLAILSGAIVFQSVSLLFTRAFYAEKNARYPFISYVLGFIVGLIVLFSIDSERGIGVAFVMSGAATAISLGYFYKITHGFNIIEFMSYLGNLIVRWVPIVALSFWIHFILSLITNDKNILVEIMSLSIALSVGLYIGVLSFRSSSIPEAHTCIKSLQSLIYYRKIL
jgi:putative peptidoglycan lipid II flippase